MFKTLNLSQIDGKIPVSYTHLDVYKRQKFFSVDRLLFTRQRKHCFGKVLICKHSIQVFGKHIFGKVGLYHARVERICKPVSYTHLDVYKRQEFHSLFGDSVRYGACMTLKRSGVRSTRHSVTARATAGRAACRARSR